MLLSLLLPLLLPSACSAAHWKAAAALAASMPAAHESEPPCGIAGRLRQVMRARRLARLARQERRGPSNSVSGSRRVHCWQKRRSPPSPSGTDSAREWSSARRGRRQGKLQMLAALLGEPSCNPTGHWAGQCSPQMRWRMKNGRSESSTAAQPGTCASVSARDESPAIIPQRDSPGCATCLAGTQGSPARFATLHARARTWQVCGASMALLGAALAWLATPVFFCGLSSWPPRWLAHRCLMPRKLLARDTMQTRVQGFNMP